jgi:hypothetical protein
MFALLVEAWAGEPGSWADSRLSLTGHYRRAHPERSTSHPGRRPSEILALTPQLPSPTSAGRGRLSPG